MVQSDLELFDGATSNRKSGQELFVEAHCPNVSDV